MVNCYKKLSSLADKVFANIARTEIESMEMKAWLETLPIHSYDVKSGREIIAEKTAADATKNSTTTKTTETTTTQITNGEVIEKTSADDDGAKKIDDKPVTLLENGARNGVDETLKSVVTVGDICEDSNKTVPISCSESS